MTDNKKMTSSNDFSLCNNPYYYKPDFIWYILKCPYKTTALCTILQ